MYTFGIFASLLCSISKSIRMPVPEPGSMICADGCSWSLWPKKPLAAKDTSRNGLVFNNEHKRGCSKSFLIHNLSLHMAQRLLLLSSVSLLNMLNCVLWHFLTFFLLVFYLFRSFPNRQLVNWLRWQMLRTDAYWRSGAPLRPLTSRSARRTWNPPKSRVEIEIASKKNKSKNVNHPFSSFDLRKKSALSDFQSPLKVRASKVNAM